MMAVPARANMCIAHSNSVAYQSGHLAGNLGPSWQAPAGVPTGQFTTPIDSHEQDIQRKEDGKWRAYLEKKHPDAGEPRCMSDSDADLFAQALKHYGVNSTITVDDFNPGGSDTAKAAKADSNKPLTGEWATRLSSPDGSQPKKHYKIESSCVRFDHDRGFINNCPVKVYVSYCYVNPPQGSAGWYDNNCRKQQFGGIFLDLGESSGTPDFGQIQHIACEQPGAPNKLHWNGREMRAAFCGPY